MKLLFLLLGALIAAVSLALLAQQDPGYVLLRRADWSLETSLSFAVVVLVLGFGALYLLVRFGVNTWTLPNRLRAWRRQRRVARARRISQRGLIELAEGHWSRAERDLIRAAEYSDTPLLNYLGAARAAQKLEADRRRDHYLSLAHQSMPDAALAVGLTQAEVQLSNGQLEQALATLMHLRSLAPKHTHVLYLLKRLYEQLDSWGDLAELAPDLRRHKVLEAGEVDALEAKAHARLLHIAAGSGKPERLREAWAAVPRPLQGNPAVVAVYARELDCLGDPAQAERLLRDALKRQWEPELVRLYGLVRGEDPARQLATAEGWLKRYQRHPLLLLTLARLSLHNRLWGKARAYLEASLGMEERPETHRELASLLFQFEEPEAALEHYRKGLELAIGGEACTRFEVGSDPAYPALPRSGDIR